MDQSRNPVSREGKPITGVVFSHGYWWYCDPQKVEHIQLDPLFRKYGWQVDGICGHLGIGTRTFNL
jgi:hypothetical protein